MGDTASSLNAVLGRNRHVVRDPLKCCCHFELVEYSFYVDVDHLVPFVDLECF